MTGKGFSTAKIPVRNLCIHAPSGLTSEPTAFPPLEYLHERVRKLKATLKTIAAGHYMETKLKADLEAAEGQIEQIRRAKRG